MNNRLNGRSTQFDLNGLSSVAQPPAPQVQVQTQVQMSPSLSTQPSALQPATQAQANVRTVTLHKESQSSRVGIYFYQTTPDELLGSAGDQIVLPVIKVLDKAGIAGNCPDLHEGDQVLSVNGHAALSNVQTVQMLRDAVGPLTLAVRETVISKTPRGATNRVPLTGLRPINMPPS